MSDTTRNAVVAIYIGSNGEIVASERIENERAIAENQLSTPPGPSDETEFLEVEVSVALALVSEGGGKRNRNYVMQRVCYDRFGRRVPCVGG
jgi:hypothetical protein